jgi:hypothetical protein
MSENARRKNIDAMRGSDPSAFAPPIARLIGMRALSFDDGSAVLELDAGARHANPMGTLHRTDGNLFGGSTGESATCLHGAIAGRVTGRSRTEPASPTRY